LRTKILLQIRAGGRIKAAVVEIILKALFVANLGGFAIGEA
jgi:hypothetical protein